MSILNVEHMSHGFGGRTIFEDASFRLLKGEHIALVGANGEGKSTFLSIITGQMTPDEGKVEWAKRVTTGYLDQHAVLKPGMTIRDVLKTAFDEMYKLEQEMLAAYDKMAEASPEEMDKMMADVGDIQDILEAHSFYTLDSKIEEVAGGLGLRDIGLDKPVDALSGGQRTKVLLTKLLLQSPDILILDEPTNFLDVEHIEWLKTYLQGYENAFILVSHDVPFLNAVTNVIYHVENATLTRYTGSYENFRKCMLSSAGKKMQPMSGSRRRLPRRRTLSSGTRPELPPEAWPIPVRSVWTKWSYWKSARKSQNLILISRWIEPLAVL